LLLSVFALIFVIGAFIRFPDSGFRGLIMTVFNFLHFPVFMLLYFIGQRCFIFTLPPRFSSALAARLTLFAPLLMCWVIAIFVELTQPLLQRSATWSDLMISGSGAFLGFWLLYLIHLNRMQPKPRIKAALLTVLFISAFSAISVYLLRPIYAAGQILALKHRVFPLLSTHELPHSPLHWFPLPQRDPQYKNDQTVLSVVPCPLALNTSFDAEPAPKHCIRVDPAAQSWSGLGQIFGVDTWRGYEKLEIFLSTDQDQIISLRIDDASSTHRHQDRFNREFNSNRA
ncbi:MAG: hypothetical protein P8077_09945, partial [Gammaproteobacteria bacterium]